jgi:hypothetical protein
MVRNKPGTDEQLNMFPVILIDSAADLTCAVALALRLTGAPALASCFRGEFDQSDR